MGAQQTGAVGAMFGLLNYRVSLLSLMIPLPQKTSAAGTFCKVFSFGFGMW